MNAIRVVFTHNKRKELSQEDSADLSVKTLDGSTDGKCSHRRFCFLCSLLGGAGGLPLPHDLRSRSSVLYHVDRGAGFGACGGTQATKTVPKKKRVDLRERAKPPFSFW